MCRTYHTVHVFSGVQKPQLLSMDNTRFLSNSNFRQNETIIDGFYHSVRIHAISDRW